SVDQVEYELAQVTREDVQLVKDLYCTYQQTREETLCFGTTGRPVRYVHVKVGDNVKQGDLLAELKADDLEEEIREVRYTIDKNTLLLAQLEELMAFDLEELRAQYGRGGLTRAQYEERAEQIRSDYGDRSEGYQDTLYIMEMRMEKLQKELEGCRIYAGIDGMVSMVHSKLSEGFLKEGDQVIKVIDKSHCIFCLDDLEYQEYFLPGQEFTLINNNGTEYSTKVMSPEEAPDKEKIYFALTETDATLTVGTRAFARLVLEEKKDVLALPPNVVHRAGEKSYVYCEDENGFKSVRYITTGLVGSKYVEIVDGLIEGEMVIRR
ncbi:MAG: biotin/lipoyl-binding protein, partial [Lachnospiraceae bacterium]|nr:biotin/lipoyl-binding protein [Lachnospiraceae bacterium]